MSTTKRRILILGGHGTLGTAMRHHLSEHASDWEVHAWNRKAQPLAHKETDASTVSQFEQTLLPWLTQHRPHVVFNFAVAGGMCSFEAKAITVDLPVWLADASLELGFRLVHTSSVMVFASDHQGPYTLDTQPSATEGYGLQKRQAEEGILARAQDPRALVTIARLGWQIGADPAKNTMRRFLEDQASQNGGRIRASSMWIPSCSRLEHTVDKLWALAHRDPGLYQIEGNPGLSFADIATKLRSEYGNRPWTIERTEDFVYTQGVYTQGVYTQRMVDNRLDMPPLFPAL